MTPDALREEAMAVLAEVWSLSPDVRLGQLFAHLGFLGEAHLGRGLGDIEDDEIMAVLYRHRAELTARLQATPSPTRGLSTSVSGSPTLLQEELDRRIEELDQNPQAGVPWETAKSRVLGHIQE
jgi:Putative addiction module component